MPRGVWDIYCHVCGEVAAGPPHGTTCFVCEALGYKYCTTCDSIKTVDQFYQRPDTGKYMTKCISCYKAKRNKDAAINRCNPAYIALRNAQSVACKQRKYATEEGRLSEILRCHERRLILKQAGGSTSTDFVDALEYFGHQCAYCGATDALTVEHIIPVSNFGANKRYNIIPACSKCNSSKSNKDILDWYPKQSFYSAERLLKIHSWFKDQQEVS